MDADPTISTFGLDANMQELVERELDVYEHTDKPLHEARKSLLDKTDIAIIFIFSDVNEDVCSTVDLDAVISLGAGTDHIDKEICHQEGITVCNTPHYGSHTVAEHGFAMLLSFERHLASIENKSLDFPRQRYLGRQLAGKQFGAIGTGGIGEAAIRIAQGFNMETVGYDPDEKQGLQDDASFTYKTKNDVIRQSDYVGLYVPAMPATEDIIDRHSFNLMKSDAVLMNTARASLLDHDSLQRALNEGSIRGAVLDVVAPSHETVMKDHDRTIVTPHHAFYTKEALHNMVKQAREAVQSIRAGEEPTTIV